MSSIPYASVKSVLRGLAMLLALAALAWLAGRAGLDQVFDTAWVDRHLRGRGIDGEALFVMLGFVASALGLPRQIVAFVGGYAFGILYGTALAMLATVAGSAAAFAYARLFGRGMLAGRLGGRIARFDDFVREHPFSMTLLIRLLPVGSNLATNLAAGLSSIAARPFLLGSALGFVPQTVVFALVGSGVNVDPAWRIGLGIALFVASALLGLHLYRKFRHGKCFDARLDNESET